METITKKTTSIRKLKNFEGHVHICSCCGRELKHAFSFGDDHGVYGQRCVLNMTGGSYTAEKRMKDLIKIESGIYREFESKGHAWWMDAYKKDSIAEVVELIMVMRKVYK